MSIPENESLMLRWNDNLLSPSLAKIGKVQPTPSESTPKPGSIASDFGKTLSEEINKVNALENNASQHIQAYATGEEVDLHQVILASSKAEMAMSLALQVRNKMISAYQELSRMQI